MNELWDNSYEPECGGYRLQRIEISNWGTFDSTEGSVHVFRVDGQNALLVGENGAGKSTAVDAILTLLVKPGSRNYNVAAGGKQRERDERSYIRGAFGRSGREEDNAADIKYLREASRHFSILLAVFKNGRGEIFTVAQVLHTAGDGDVTKVYALARKDMSISEDLSGLASTEKLRQQVANRDFKATVNYSDFHTWLCDLTGMRSKAMEMFNQTVALKDIQSLNAFIRDHMLELQKWEDEIDQLQRHFQDLTEAHAALVRVQQKSDMLAPIKAKGSLYADAQSRMTQIRRTVEALEFFFLEKVLALGQSKLSAISVTKQKLTVEAHHLDKRQSELDETIRQLSNEIENAGGQRARDLPKEIALEKERGTNKLERASRARESLNILGLKFAAWDSTSWEMARSNLDGVKKATETERDTLKQQHEDLVGRRGELRRSVREFEDEIASLSRRRGNLPRYLDQARRKLCDDLSLSISELPFASELVDVKESDREWQASIEMVLRGYALTMLVPRRHAQVVSKHIDGRRQTDDRGDGVKIHYEPVAEGVRSDRRQLLPKTMLSKLEFRQEHPLWTAVKAVIEDRLDHRCCDSVDEWKESSDNAITKNRHVRTRQRHLKDDRNQAMNAANFVLGWDNAAKIRAIATELTKCNDELKTLGDVLARIDKALGGYVIRLQAVETLQTFGAFAEVDHATHERRVLELQQELRDLQERDENTRTLKAARSKAEQEHKTVKESRDAALKSLGNAENEERRVNALVGIATPRLREAELMGSLPMHREQYGVIINIIDTAEIAFEQLQPLEEGARRRLNDDRESTSKQVEDIGAEILQDMARFTNKFREEEDDLQVSLDYLDSYLDLERRISEDDLPQYAERFRSRLNEKMLDEIGLLNFNFTAASNEIKLRIEQLNAALSKLDYQEGTRMQLACRATKDPEILAFKEQLRDCTSGSFEHTPEADEERFHRISRLLIKLKDEQNWKQRVTDVRRWFDFVARELRRDDGTEVNFFQDGHGQSGGEKAKLAFTILVAGLAYQYDLDLAQPKANRFNFVVVDEMFSKVGDQYSKYAMRLFARFNLQLLVVAPLDAKARVTEEFVGCYLHVIKNVTHNPDRCTSEVFHMTAAEFENLSAKDEAVGTLRDAR